MDGFVPALMRQLDVLPMLIIALLSMYFMLREVRTKIASMSDKMDDHRNQIALLKSDLQKDIAKLKSHSDEMDAKHDKRLEELNVRVTGIEMGHMPKEDIYRLMGGWRSDLSRIENAIEKLRDRP